MKFYLELVLIHTICLTDFRISTSNWRYDWKSVIIAAAAAILVVIAAVVAINVAAIVVVTAAGLTPRSGELAPNDERDDI